MGEYQLRTHLKQHYKPNGGCDKGRDRWTYNALANRRASPLKLLTAVVPP